MYLGVELKRKDKTALIDDTGSEMTYGRLSEFIENISNYIIKRSIVFCLCENTIESVAGYIAFISNRVVPLLISSDMDRDLLKELINTYEPTYLWIPKRYGEEFDGTKIIECNEYLLIKTGFETYQIYDDLALLLTTSGSTGSPKLVRHSYNNLNANAKNVAAVFGYTEKDRGMADLPMQYTMGLSVINSHIYAGATVLLTTKNIMSKEFWDYLKDKKATNFTGVPFSYELLKKLRFTRMDLPDLKILAQGGGRLTDEIFIELAEYCQKSGKRFFATYGQTECTARMTFLPPEIAVQKIGSIGKAIPEGELYLMDENGNHISRIEAEGEMCYRGPNVTLGYATCKDDLLNGDERHAYIITGDIARRDRDGMYFIIGRKSRFLKLLGYRISLDQCETLIRSEFGIECACTGSDEEMHIYITDGSKAELIKKFISAKTKILSTKFKVFIISQIPKNESGKIMYKLLSK